MSAQSDPEKPFGEFDPVTRPFWINVRDLAVWRTWCRAADEVPDGEMTEPLRKIERIGAPAPSIEVHGTALSEDVVCVIGKLDISRNNFPLKIRCDARAVERWRRVDADMCKTLDESAPTWRLHTLIRERLLKRPPTASLGVAEPDRDLNNSGGWWFECEVPSAVLKQLEDDIAAGCVDSVRIGIDWEGGLVHGGRFAPPGREAKWGLMTIPGGYGPEPLYGHVQSITWQRAIASVTQSAGENSSSERLGR